MTSMMTREDVEDLLYQAGVRSPFARTKVMRGVDLYAACLASKMIPLEDEDPYGYLEPGQADVPQQVIRCRSCLKPKKFRHFPADRSLLGRDTVCRQCQPPRPVTPLPAGPGRRYLCRACGTQRLLTEFPEGKAIHPERGYKCLHCAPVQPITEVA